MNKANGEVKVNAEGLVEYMGKVIKPYRYDRKTGIVVFRYEGKAIRAKVKDRIIERKYAEKKSKRINERKSEVKNTLLSEYLKTMSEGNESKGFAIWCDLCSEAQPYIYPDIKLPEWKTRLLEKIKQR